MNEDFTGMSGYISMIGDILLEYGKHDEARKKYLNALELIQNSRTAPEELKIEAKKTVKTVKKEYKLNLDKNM